MNLIARIDTSIACAVAELKAHSDSPRLDAELLLGKILGLSRAALLARGSDALSAVAQRDFDLLLGQRRGGMPVAYLTGRREFWSLPLTVTPAVLIPRPETELLVATALTHIPDHGPSQVLDLGTGSGAIALAIATERRHARIVAVDVSAGALEVARSNAHALDLRGIDWRLGSWFEPLAAERFNFILSNPPYIAATDPALSSLGAEPRIALTPGASGLEALILITQSARAYLEHGGWLILEHGFDQAPEVRELLGRHGFQSIETLIDHAGLPRVTLGISL